MAVSSSRVERKAAAADLFFGESGEAAFHLVELADAGGCEVNVESWVLDQPALNEGGFVGGVVMLRTTLTGR